MIKAQLARVPKAGLAAAKNFVKDVRRSVDTRLLNLNVGSGDYHIEGFVDVDVPSDWYEKRRKGKQFVPYNMRSDNLPFDDGVVDNIYCSHVIEHIEDSHVVRFFEDAARVLKPGGVLRIACPDAEFLWEVSQFDNRYWKWRSGWFKNRVSDFSKVDQKDYLVRELATRKVRQLNPEGEILHAQLFSLPFEEAMEKLSGDEFDLNRLGDHINRWDFAKVERLGGQYFSHVLRSKYQGSVSPSMIGPEFDQTWPRMSLYVELIR